MLNNFVDEEKEVRPAVDFFRRGLTKFRLTIAVNHYH